MADYGMRISADGVDVKTGDDKNMILTSKYSMLKGSLSGSGTVSVAQNGTEQTITIAHGLGYIPMIQAFAKDNNSDYFDPYYYLMPIYNYWGAGTEIAWKAYADTTNVYLKFYYNDDGYGGPNVSITYTYYIFIDKGDL